MSEQQDDTHALNVSIRAQDDASVALYGMFGNHTVAEIEARGQGFQHVFTPLSYKQFSESVKRAEGDGVDIFRYASFCEEVSSISGKEIFSSQWLDQYASQLRRAKRWQKIRARQRRAAQRRHNRGEA